MKTKSLLFLLAVIASLSNMSAQDMTSTPFTMEAIESGTFSVVNPQNLLIYYKVNDGDVTSSKENPINIVVESGDKVEFGGHNESYCTEGTDATNFRSTGACYVYGNIMSLINRNTYSTNVTLTKPYAFSNLFVGDDNLEPNYSIRSHPNKELVLPATKLTNMCYSMMFQGCRGITTPPALPATALAPLCYNDMFADCTGLTEAPKLPSTSLAMGCYTMMFYGCTSLTKAPDLPATVLPPCCYDSMFSGCSSLSYVKCLATSINGFATSNWMDGVADMGTFVKMSQMHGWTEGADGIPAGWNVAAAAEADGDNGAIPLTLEATAEGTITISNPKGLNISYEHLQGDNHKYASFNTTTTFDMNEGDKLILKGNNTSYGDIDFSQSTHISSTADIYVYGNVMSLIDSDNYPTLTQLEGSMNFASLFGTDTSTNSTIKNHPTKDIVLGATELTESCYVFMFAGCQGLTRAPELPATVLAPVCYHRMFGNCTSLVKAPKLPAPSLSPECYFAMFDGCEQLSYVDCSATDISAQGCTAEWLHGVAASGTFVAANGMEAWNMGADGIPEGWSNTGTPLTLEATEDGTTITIANPLGLMVSYTTDNGDNWSMTSDYNIIISELDAGNTVSLKGFNDAYSTDGTTANSTVITTDKDCYIYGNVMSLVGNDDFPSLTTLSTSYALSCLFYNSDKIKNHPTKKLLLPATTLNTNCYRYMFRGCKGLSEAPALPATELSERCYFGMFLSCTSLEKAPELPATKLAVGCYTGTFAYCKFSKAPALPATELTAYCYYQMFYGCDNLTEAPVLPALTIPNSAYNMMFRGCTRLTEMPQLPATKVYGFGYNMMFRGCTGLTTTGEISATHLEDDDSMQGMFYDCTNLKTATDLKITNMTGSSNCQFMFSGCTSLEKGPALPAKTLTPQCYNRMFNECSSLVSPPALPATDLAYLCYNDMFWNCTSLTTAPALPATTLTDYCYTMMFYGCTSLEKAPDLPAEHIPSGAYEHMFMNCTSLNYVKCLAKSIEDSESTAGWLTNVSEKGTFLKSPEMEEWTVGKNEYEEVSGIPEGWTVEDAETLTYNKGDVNRDGMVDISDIVFVINCIASGSDNISGDVNEDGKTDISDIVAIINIIAESPSK